MRLESICQELVIPQLKPTFPPFKIYNDRGMKEITGYERGARTDSGQIISQLPTADNLPVYNTEQLINLRGL